MVEPGVTRSVPSKSTTVICVWGVVELEVTGLVLFAKIELTQNRSASIIKHCFIVIKILNERQITLAAMAWNSKDC